MAEKRPSSKRPAGDPRKRLKPQRQGGSGLCSVRSRVETGEVRPWKSGRLCLTALGWLHMCPVHHKRLTDGWGGVGALGGRAGMGVNV